MNATSMTKRTGRGLVSWVGAVALLAAFSASALAATGITNTKHNLSSTGPGNKFSGTDQICVFCHTPHGSDTSAPAPLWNRTLASGAAYTTYDTLGTTWLDGKVLEVGSISLACLSCHDGTQAMNSVINAPGSGTTNAAWTAGSWTAGASGMGGGISGGMLTGVVALGQDLSDDHPIGIQYCGGGVNGDGTSSFTGSTCADGDFVGTGSTTTSDGRTAQLKTAQINNAQQFWVELGGNATRSKTDIPLYNRSFTGVGGSANTPSVECGSCHDPHVEKIGNNVAFMRVDVAGSKICLSCHVK